MRIDLRHRLISLVVAFLAAVGTAAEINAGVWYGSSVGDERWVVGQDNHYYPYGMLMGESSNILISASKQRLTFTGGINPYHFGSKEYLTTASANLLDFTARTYDPATLLFLIPDPLSEKFTTFNSYLYCASDPINNIDDEGREVLCLRKSCKAAKEFPDNGNLIILAHGNFNGIYNEFSDKYIYNTSDFIHLLNEETSDYKDIGTGNKHAYIELLSCHSGENQTKDSKPFAQRLTENLKNVVIKAPNGVLYIGVNTKQMKVMGSESNTNKSIPWRFFYNGSEITRTTACFIQMLIHIETFFNEIIIENLKKIYDDISKQNDSMGQ